MFHIGAIVTSWFPSWFQWSASLWRSWVSDGGSCEKNAGFAVVSHLCGRPSLFVWCRWALAFLRHASGSPTHTPSLSDPRKRCKLFGLIASDWWRDNLTSVQNLSMKARSNTTSNFRNKYHHCRDLHMFVIKYCVQQHSNMYLRAGGLRNWMQHYNMCTWTINTLWLNQMNCMVNIVAISKGTQNDFD